MCRLFVVVRLPSCVWFFMTSWTARCQASLSLTISQFPQVHVHWIGDAIQSPHPLPPTSPSAFNILQPQALFHWVSSLHQVAKILQLQLQHQSFQKECSGLISFKIDCFDLLVVQKTLKSLLYHHSSKASILWCSAFFIVQLSCPYRITGKTIALTRWTFVGKVMSLYAV